MSAYALSPEMIQIKESIKRTDPVIIDINGVQAVSKYLIAGMLSTKLKRYGFKTAVVNLPLNRWYSRMLDKYIGGGFGNDPYKINSYIMAVIYAINTFITYNLSLRWYKNVDFLILCSYTSECVLFQGSKLCRRDIDPSYGLCNTDKPKLKAFIDFIFKLEYEFLKLPKTLHTFIVDTNSATISAEATYKSLFKTIYSGEETQLRTHNIINYVANEAGWIRWDTPDLDEYYFMYDLTEEMMKHMFPKYEYSKYYGKCPELQITSYHL